MIERLALDVVVALESFSDGARIGKDLAGLRNKIAIAMLNPLSDACPLGISRKIIERGTPKIIGRAILMHDPQDFSFVRHKIGGKLHPDHQIDWLSIRG